MANLIIFSTSFERKGMLTFHTSWAVLLLWSSLYDSLVIWAIDDTEYALRIDWLWSCPFDSTLFMPLSKRSLDKLAIAYVIWSISLFVSDLAVWLPSNLGKRLYWLCPSNRLTEAHLGPTLAVQIVMYSSANGCFWCVINHSYPYMSVVHSKFHTGVYVVHGIKWPV